MHTHKTPLFKVSVLKAVCKTEVQADGRDT